MNIPPNQNPDNLSTQAAIAQSPSLEQGAIATMSGYELQIYLDESRQHDLALLEQRKIKLLGSLVPACRWNTSHTELMKLLNFHHSLLTDFITNLTGVLTEAQNNAQTRSELLKILNSSNLQENTTKLFGLINWAIALSPPIETRILSKKIMRQPPNEHIVVNNSEIASPSISLFLKSLDLFKENLKLVVHILKKDECINNDIDEKNSCTDEEYSVLNEINCAVDKTNNDVDTIKQILRNVYKSAEDFNLILKEELRQTAFLFQGYNIPKPDQPVTEFKTSKMDDDILQLTFGGYYVAQESKLYKEHLEKLKEKEKEKKSNAIKKLQVLKANLPIKAKKTTNKNKRSINTLHTMLSVIPEEQSEAVNFISAISTTNLQKDSAYDVNESKSEVNTDSESQPVGGARKKTTKHLSASEKKKLKKQRKQKAINPDQQQRGNAELVKIDLNSALNELNIAAPLEGHHSQQKQPIPESHRQQKMLAYQQQKEDEKARRKNKIKTINPSDYSELTIFDLKIHELLKSEEWGITEEVMALRYIKGKDILSLIKSNDINSLLKLLKHLADKLNLLLAKLLDIVTYNKDDITLYLTVLGELATQLEKVCRSFHPSQMRSDLSLEDCNAKAAILHDTCSLICNLKSIINKSNVTPDLTVVETETASLPIMDLTQPKACSPDFIESIELNESVSKKISYLLIVEPPQLALKVNECVKLKTKIALLINKRNASVNQLKQATNDLSLKLIDIHCMLNEIVLRSPETSILKTEGTKLVDEYHSKYLHSRLSNIHLLPEREIKRVLIQLIDNFLQRTQCYCEYCISLVMDKWSNNLGQFLK